MNLVRMLQAVIAIPPRLGQRRCAMCGHRVGRFIPYPGGQRAVPALMTELDVIGSDVEHFECPRCGAHDRERHVLLYMRASGIFEKLSGLRILHFAPERRLSRMIADAKPPLYEKCDLFPATADVRKVDIEDMPFPDRAFDLVIANHVLEHVDDDLKALGEIWRVLEVGGHAILQTPYSTVLHATWRDRGITRERARRHAYGQEDHVRLFGRDIFERFASGGMQPRIGLHEDLLHAIDSGRYGVNPREPFFLFQRVA